MHPVSTALFLLGYGLGLPIVFRIVRVVTSQHRLAFAGHQIAMGIAALGWLISGRLSVAVVHGVWMIVARLWFVVGGNRQSLAADHSGG